MADSDKTAVIIMGVLLILLGLLASKYTIVLTEENLLSKKSYTERPYENYSIPLIIAGIVLVIVGSVMSGGSERVVKEIRERPVRERVITSREED